MKNKVFSFAGIFAIMLIFGMTVIGCDFGSINEEIQGKWVPEGTVPIGGRVYEFRGWTMSRWFNAGLGWSSVTRIEIAIPRGSGQINRSGVTYQAGQTHHRLYYYEMIGDGVMRMRRFGSSDWITFHRVDDWPWSNRPRN